MALSNPRVFWHWFFVLFLVVYAAILAAQLGHGLASLDGHAIIKVTNDLIAQHRLEVSRPPGHPTTEIYLLPAIAWLLQHLFNAPFDQQAYLVVQGIGGVAALYAFHALLLWIGVHPWKAIAASICLGLSPQFFFNSVDGEEFVLAILFLTLSFYQLGKVAESQFRRYFFAALLWFAVATGCRPEVIFAGFLFPLYALLDPEWGWRKVGGILVTELALIAAVWLPILWAGVRPLYPAGMNVSESILGAGYRLMFQCFTFPVFLLICWILFQAAREWRWQIAKEFPRNYLFIIGCTTPFVFFAALFFHASKPSHVLFALPFLLILAVYRSPGLLATWAIATVIGFFVTIDIFKERHVGKPHLVAGSYFKAVGQKPFYKLDYVQRAVEQCGAAPTAVIADVWRWDIEYHVRRGTLAAQEQLHGDVPVFYVASAAGRWGASPVEDSPWRARTMGPRLMPQQDCVLVPRDGALHPALLDDLAVRGYSLKMDATLYRTLFARYDVITPATNKGRIGNTMIELFPVTAPWR